MLPRFSHSKFLRSPNDVGSVPDKPLSLSISRTTRPSALVVTPYHSSSGLSLSQFALFVQLSPFVAPYSATRAARSGLGSTQLTTPYLVSMPCSHRWKAASNGAHNCVLRRSSVCKLVRLTNDDGSPPDKALSLRLSHSKLVRLPNHDGSPPDKALLPRSSVCKFLRLPNHDGSPPDKALSASPSTCRLVRLPNHDGSPPENSLPSKASSCKLVRLPRDDGSTPDNWFLTSLSTSKWVRSPNDDGILPDNWLS